MFPRTLSHFPLAFSDPLFPQFTTRLPDGTYVPTVPDTPPAYTLKLPGSVLELMFVSLKLVGEMVAGG